MTIKELLGYSVADLEAMDDATLAKLCAPFVRVVEIKEEEKVEKKEVTTTHTTTTKKSSKNWIEEAKRLMAQYGIEQKELELPKELKH